MMFKFEPNEFTAWDLLEYLDRAYGGQVNGQPFAINNVNSWIRMKRLSDAYGGNRILKVDCYKELENLRVLTIERLDREDIEAVYGTLAQFKETLNKRRAKLPKACKQKQRTELYYQLLGSRIKKGKRIAFGFITFHQ